MKWLTAKQKRPADARDERGAVAIEFLGTFIFIFFMVLITWQGFLAMNALTQANSAARDASRAESVEVGAGQDAGMNALGASLQSGSVISCGSSGGDRVSCEAEVNVPVIAAGPWGEALPDFTVSRSATMPAGGN